jgi:multidrug efflux system membrane fusion protein
MKIGPLVIAVLVAVALYAFVFERERLLELARGPGETPLAEAGPDAVPAQAEAVETAARRVAVVAIDSIARDVENAVVLRGQTEAARQVEVRSQTSGLVASTPQRKGSFVRTGDTLCEVDPGNRPADLAEAQAKLAEAEISNVAAERLAEGGFGSETRKLSAEAALESARAAVERAETEIARLVIKAPFDGVLETDAAELGSLLQPGSPCATVIQLDPIKLVAFLPETAVAKVSTGAPATATLSDGRDVAGNVTFLARSADPDTRTFRVEIAVENDDLSIRDGQSANISITAAGLSAHFIPASALTLDNTGEMGVRVVDADNIVHFKPVRIVRDTPKGIYVAGLPDAARIIVVGQEFVSEGVVVDVTLQGDGA